MTTTRLGRLTIFTVTPAQLGGLYIFTAKFLRSHHEFSLGPHTQIILRRRGRHHPTIDAASSRRTNAVARSASLGLSNPHFLGSWRRVLGEARRGVAVEGIGLLPLLANAE